MNNQTHIAADDPLSWAERIANKLRSLWLVHTYPFASVGDRFSVHHSVEIQRSMAGFIRIGNSVTMGRDVWINIPEEAPESDEPVIILEDGCKIGRRCVISAGNRIHIERNAVFAPSVLIMDHDHAFEDVNIPIGDQGITKGGTIRIEEGCWIGFGAAVLCGKKELVIGRNSVIGANSLVTRSVPPYSVVSGNPARVVKSYDPIRGEWVLGSASASLALQARER